MRAVYWKELRELLAPVIVLAALGSIYVADKHWHLPKSDLLGLVTVVGIALGLAQGVLDRLHRDDHFLLHRPVSLTRLHGARTLAGFSACLLALLVVLAVHGITLATRWQYGANKELVSPLSGYFAACAVMLAVWAVVRSIVTIRRLWAIAVLLVAVPFVINATWGRTPSEFTGGLFMLAVAVVAAGLLVVALAGSRTRLRAALLLVVIGFVTLETTTWLRLGAMELQMDAYPYLSVKSSGELILWDRRGLEVQEYDTERNLVNRWHASNRPPNVQWLTVGVGPWYGPDLFEGPKWLFDRRLRWSAWTRSIEWRLNREQESFLLRWSLGDGRFLCRDRDGNVVAGFGPDGYVRGSRAAEGRGFDVGRPNRYGEFPWVWRGKGVFHYLDPSSGSVAVFELPEKGAPPEEPLEIQVTVRPLDAPAKTELPLDSVPFRRLVMGSQVVWMDHRGDVVLRVDLEAEERYITSWPLVRWEVVKMEADGPRREPREILASAIVTRLGPVHPVKEQLRVRVLRPGEAMVVHDVAITPETMGEHLCLALQGVTGLIRPLPLALASFFAAPPQDWDELHSWFWIDPFFTGATSGVWLFLSVVVAAACGWLGRRQARLRCATDRAVRFWTVAGALLGPMGLVWMWLVVGRVRVEPVGTGRRAVNLERSPEVAEPWPEPLPTGTEVHA
ncbi:MAG: hypothetical protein ACYTF8_02320 [Planctomycetota bacterium]|jgi:hypothetical protein